MEVTIEAVKTLREQTGAGIMDCKRALQDAEGDISKAQGLLRKKGAVAVAKKAARETQEGLVECYVHTGNRIASMVEVNCETDFVARTPEFSELAHDLAMQIAAMSPTYVDHDSMPPELNRNAQDLCLFEQSFIKDPTKIVKDVVQEVAAKVGENIRVRRFSRFALGD